MKSVLCDGERFLFNFDMHLFFLFFHFHFCLWNELYTCTLAAVVKKPLMENTSITLALPLDQFADIAIWRQKLENAVAKSPTSLLCRHCLRSPNDLYYVSKTLKAHNGMQYTRFICRDLCVKCYHKTIVHQREEFTKKGYTLLETGEECILSPALALRRKKIKVT